MKKVVAAVVVVMLAGVASSWAVTNTFVVTQFRGTLTSTNGVTPITGTQISTNELVLVVSDDAHLLALSEVDGTSTNVVIDQFRTAFIGGGKFEGDVDGAFNPVDPSIVDFDGDLQFTGKLSPAPGKGTPTKVSATIIGVWTQSPDTIFKGTLKGAR